MNTMREKSAGSESGHVPMRTCVGCRSVRGKKALMRLVRGKDGRLEADLLAKREGRGAYLCREEACLAKALKTRALERALGAAISEEELQKVREALTNNGS